MARTSADGNDLVARIKVVLWHISRGISVIIAPHATGTTVTFNLTGRLAVLLLVVVIAMVVGLAFVGITYTRLSMLAFETTRLRAENEVLRRENERINEIELELANIDRIRREIENWAGIVAWGEEDAMSTGTEPMWPSSTWPRKYSYAIMRPVYLWNAASQTGMLRPAAGWVSRRFIDDSGKATGHPGIDIAASMGTPVRCALDGVVKSAKWDDVYGNLIMVQHDDSLATVYGHNDKILVKEGGHVTRGEVIATVGNTGRSTAPHLHFEVVVNGRPVDPELYIDFDND
jgi:murein DD-endopeptidase MepM/ murein hydrolase activator NlpD